MARDANRPSPFHTGELEVQTRVGVREEIEPRARQAIRSLLSQQQRDFFRQLPFVIAAGRDAEHRIWATLLAGSPGFVAATDSAHLQLGAWPIPGDALETSMVVGAEIGLLGIDLASRRRHRVNGTITGCGPDGIHIAVRMAFGNCPRYINPRTWQTTALPLTTPTARRSNRLDGAMQKWIKQADTLFIASGYSDRESGERAGGLDASHRGGPPGFVNVLDATRLVLPDYAGNNYFNTIGNLVRDPGVGLLLVDFHSGSLLQISGTATIDWDSARIADYPGAQRLICVTLERVVQLNGMLPLRWTALPASAFQN